MGFLDALERGFEKPEFEYRDPTVPPWGKPETMPPCQIEGWNAWQNNKRPKVALIGAKGSGKTHLGAMIAAHQMQKYPGSVGMVCSNTFGQVKKNALPIMNKVFTSLGLNFTVHKSITVNNTMFDQVIVLHNSDEIKTFLCLVSFENISTIEGSEWDWQWFEEIQDAEEEDFVVANSRRRGHRANRGCFIAGMPDDEFHWMYRLLPKLGFRDEKDRVNVGPKANGAFIEPKLIDNLENVGQDYLDDLIASHDPLQAQRYIEGKRVSLNSNKVFYGYDHERNRTASYIEPLTKYDLQLPIILAVDFNVAPMCMSAYQVKEFALTDENIKEYKSATGSSSFMLLPGESWKVLCQIDEFEVWHGGTPVSIKNFLEKYGGHQNGITVIGDASGNARDTRTPGATDWSIIGNLFLASGIKDYRLVRGLVQKDNISTGEITYSNPPIKDTINRANSLLHPMDGKTKIFLLNDSQYYSGGLVRALAFAQYTPDGRVDDANDRKPDRGLPRTHFVDTFRYACWFFSGSGTDTKEDFKRSLEHLKKNAILSEKQFSSSRAFAR